MRSKPNIAISVGDPAGIGPEITVKALNDPEIWEACTPVAVGSASVLRTISGVVASDLPVKEVTVPPSGEVEPAVYVVECGLPLSPVEFGKVSKEAGEASYTYINRAIDLALDGQVEAVVTGPIHKEAINAAGCPHPGHTEIFATRTGTKRYAMMLVHGNLRVSHVSTHVSLRRACDLCKRERVLETITLTASALKDMGISEPRIAVAGLNPHAGEGGLFGDEEINEIIPAIEDALAKGLKVEGPIPPDTVFVKARGGQYDAVVAMYHDQGHIAIKVAGFEIDPTTGKWASVKGVNMTLGLPIIRTSVDHGTAFGKAGKGTANAESMVEAIKIAAVMANNRRG
ncbi:MAG: 4-hydroxythreonine-4-phosphate dehydrogenase PdxA [Bacillota bacterium]|jgi:4-hydroxythreonine-4-phosphate dehydrogenase